MTRFRDIVENELLKNTLLSEDAKSDHEFYRHAKDKFFEFVEILENSLDPNKYYFDYDVKVLLHEEFSDVLVSVYFTDQGDIEKYVGGEYIGKHISKVPNITLSLQNIYDLNNENFKYVFYPPLMQEIPALLGKDIIKLVKTSAIFSTFLHEYRHFMDDMQLDYLIKSRKKTDHLWKKIRKQKDANNDKNEHRFYRFNSDHEANAYFFSILAKVMNNMIKEVKNKKGNAAKLRELPQKERLKFFIDELNKEDSYVKEYMQRFDKDKQRNFYSRLYKFFSDSIWDELAKQAQKSDRTNEVQYISDIDQFKDWDKPTESDKTMMKKLKSLYNDFKNILFNKN